MDYLLDTHSLIWFLNGDPKLSNDATLIIKNKSNRILVSVASLWEIAIKMSLGKLEIKVSLPEFFWQINNADIEVLNIDQDAVLTVSSLPFHHKDPFDRIIITQGISKGNVIISEDA